MQRTAIPDRVMASAQAPLTSQSTEPALRVATVYQDPLTRHWATLLWDRVGQLVGHSGICRQSWRICELADAHVFTDAVQAAAEADVLVVSIRDAAHLPANLDTWIEAWIPRRAGRAGALVALIGVPFQPDFQSGRAYMYLEIVARRTGLDFMPRERKLPEGSSALPAHSRVAPAASPTMHWLGEAPGCDGALRPHSGLAG